MRSKLLNDKRAYTLGDLQGIVLVLVVIAVLFGAGLYAVGQFSNKINALSGNSNSSLEYLAVQNVTSSINQLATWLPIIVIIIAAAIIIGIVIRSFMTNQTIQ